MTVQESNRVATYTRGRVKLSKLWEDLQIHSDVNLIFVVPILDPSKCPSMPIMERDEEHDYSSLVDGYQRVAGMIRWCAANGVHPHSLMVDVAITNNRELLEAIESDGLIPGLPDKQAAIDRILSLVK